MRCCWRRPTGSRWRTSVPLAASVLCLLAAAAVSQLGPVAQFKPRSTKCSVAFFGEEQSSANFGEEQNPLFLALATARVAFAEEAAIVDFDPTRGSFDAHSLTLSAAGDPPLPAVIIFQPKPRARSCLVELPIDKDLHGTPHVFQGRHSSPRALVRFINDVCGTHRLLNGSLSDYGKQLHTIQADRYRPPAAGTPAECARISPESVSASTFLQQYVLKGRPVVIEGGLSSTQWGEDMALLWSSDYLRKEYGHETLHVKAAPYREDGVAPFEGVEPLKLWTDEGGSHPVMPSSVRRQLSYPDLVTVRPAELEMRLDDVLDKIQTQRVDRGAGNASFYIEYTSLSSHLEGLADTLGADAFRFHWASSLGEPETRNLWLGDGRTRGKLHFDPFENIISSVRGEKMFMVFHPEESHNLYEGHIQEAKLKARMKGGSKDRGQHQFRRRGGLQESTSMVMSPVDIERPDFQNFPRFESVRAPIMCRVKEGDSLFLPAHWWHEVQSTPSNAGMNLAVNLWFKPVFQKEFPCGTCPMVFNTKHYRHLVVPPSAATSQSCAWSGGTGAC